MMAAEILFSFLLFASMGVKGGKKEVIAPVVDYLDVLFCTSENKQTNK